MWTKETILLLVVTSSLSNLIEAGDTPITPIPTECPSTDPLDSTVHIQHESDCTKFYTCAHGNPVLTHCPGGLHFNPLLQVCDWPEQAGCTSGQTTKAPSTTTAKTTTTTSTQGPPPDKDPDCPWPDPLDHTVHLPHEDDCEKFHKCDNGKKVEFTCPDNLHFNKELEVCDWPSDAGCDNSSLTTSTQPPSSTTTKKSTTTKSTTTEVTTSKPTTTSQGPPPDKDPDCPWPDPLDHTVHLPHEDDCEKFYKCDNGKKVEFTCPDNLHFNKELEVCDWPSDAGCDNSSLTTTTQPPPSTTTKKSTTSKSTTTEVTTSKPTTTSQGPPPDKDPDCPWPDPLDHTVHLPHEDDCEKFYKCDNGKKVEFTCPDNLHFNKELEVCDWPSDAGCDNSSITTSTQPPSSTTTKKSTTTKSTTTEVTTTSQGPPPNKDPDCPWPDPLDHTVHLPHEDDCEKFYKCDNGKKVEFTCPDNLHFNKELEVCDWPSDAGCDNSSLTTSTQPPSSTTTKKSTTTKSTTTEVTTSKPTTTSQGPPPDKDPDCPWPDPLDHTVHLPHEDDCEKFYKCDNGKKVEFTCPDNLHFNKELEVCDWPSDAGCDNSSLTPSTQPPSSTTTKKSTTTKSTTTEVTTNKPTTTSQGPPPDKDPDCPWPDPLDHTVHLPHEDDCEKFYKCDNGKKVEFTCPDNLHFNKELEVCDWPSDAGCDNSSLTTSTQSPSSTTTKKSTTTKSTTTEVITSKPTTTYQGPPPDKDPDCPWPDPLDHTVHLPHEDDCEKFYKCDNGKKVEFTCPDNLHFNKELEVCDWPSDAGCDNSSLTTSTQPPSSTTTKKSTTTKSTTTEVTTSKPTTTSQGPPPDKDPDCPWPDPLDHTVHLPHEDDCEKFYKCDNGKKVEFTCPDNLHFNKELEVCDWPSDAGCDNSSLTTSTQPPSSTTTKKSTTTKSTTTEVTTSKPTTTSQGPPPDKDPDCPWPDPLDHTVHLPHEDDCEKFYKCDNGKKVEFTCPDNLHFNKELEVCDWPSDAGCDNSSLTTSTQSTSSSITTKSTTTTEVSTTQETTEPYNTNTPLDDITTTEAPICNPSDCDNTIYQPVSNNNRNFIRCVRGAPVLEQCPNGLVFDKVLRVCNLAHLADV